MRWSRHICHNIIQITGAFILALCMIHMALHALPVVPHVNHDTTKGQISPTFDDFRLCMVEEDN